MRLLSCVFALFLASGLHATEPTLKTYKGHVHGLVFSPDGKLLSSVGADRTVRLWDMKTGKQADKIEIDVFKDRHAKDMTLISHSPKEGLVVVAGGRVEGSGTLMFWQYGQKPQKVHRPSIVDAHGLRVSGLAFSPDGKHLYSSDIGCRTVCKWDTKTVKRIKTMVWSMPACWTLTAATKGDTLYMGGNRNIAFWKTSGDKLRGWPTEFQRTVLSIAVRKKGDLLAYADGQGLTLWSLKDLKKFRPLPYTKHTFKVAFSSDGDKLGVLQEGLFGIFDSSKGDKMIDEKVYVPYFTANGNVRDFAFSPDSKKVAIALDKGIRIETIPKDKNKKKKPPVILEASR